MVDSAGKIIYEEISKKSRLLGAKKNGQKKAEKV